MMDIATVQNGSGIYNYSNEGEISWYEFGNSGNGGYSCEVNGIPSSLIYSCKRRPSFLYWIKPRLKEIYGLCAGL
jgi:dTDP-4-dehydrorhamnose reductase